MNELLAELFEQIIDYFDNVADALAFNLICKNCANVVNNNLRYSVRYSRDIPKRFHGIKKLHIDLK